MNIKLRKIQRLVSLVFCSSRVYLSDTTNLDRVAEQMGFVWAIQIRLVADVKFSPMSDNEVILVYAF